MSTSVASRSSYLTQPGAPYVEPDDDPYVAPELPTPAQEAVRSSASEDRRAREVNWVCEWWPPT